MLRTAVRLGHAAALNIALRRAAGEIVLLADGSAIPTGDALTPLAAALADPELWPRPVRSDSSSAEPGRLRPGRAGGLRFERRPAR